MKKKTIGKPNNLIRLLLILVVAVVMLFWWYLTFYTVHHGQNTTRVAADGTFTAREDTCWYIAVCNEDPMLQDALDAEAATLSLTLTDDNGNIVWTIEEAQVRIHTNGFTNTENNYMSEEAPISLTPGEIYHLSYVCTTADGSPVTSLRFLVLGTTPAVYRLMLVLFFVAIACCGLLIWYAGKRVPVAIAGVALAGGLILTLCFLPAMQTYHVQTSFADAYALSSTLMGKDAADDSGAVFIEEDGIRNDGYGGFGEPYWRFFFDDPNHVSDRTEGPSSVFYKTDRTLMQPFSFLAALSISAARAANAPYQVVRLAGAAANGVLFLALVLICLHLLSDAPVQRRFVLCFSLLPSTLLTAVSESGIGIIFGLLLLGSAFLIRGRRRLSLVPFVLAAAGVAFAFAAFQGASASDLLTGLFTETDESIIQSIGGSTWAHRNWLFTGCLLVLMLALMAERGADLKARGLRTISPLWLIPAYLVLYLLNRCLVPSAEDLSGIYFLPWYLIPVRGRKHSFSDRTVAILDGVFTFAVFSVLLTGFTVI